MTALTSPFRILSSSSASVPSTSETPSIASNAASISPEAADLSRSAKPYDAGGGSPEKMSPKITTKISGKATVQNSAARSRRKLLRLATVSRRKALIWASVPQRSAGKGEEDVLERGPADGQVARLGVQLLADREDRADRRRNVAAVEDDLAVLPGERGHTGQSGEARVVETVDRVEADRPLVESSVDQLRDRTHLEDLAVV